MAPQPGHRGPPAPRRPPEGPRYAIQALDGDIGHVEDFILDDESWALRYMVVDTRNWWPGKRVLVSPRWIESVSWDDRAVYVDLTKEQVKSGPEYDPERMLNREDEERLYRHYGRPAYWESETRRWPRRRENRGGHGRKASSAGPEDRSKARAAPARRARMRRSAVGPGAVQWRTYTASAIWRSPRTSRFRSARGRCSAPAGPCLR
nr:MAG: hypothetical protein DIU80_09670 [Chloroflexota bacterium]